jgi:plastocyanin
LVVTLLGLAIPGSAGPDKIAFPANFENGVLYTIADRYDVKQYRELYATPEAIEAAKAGKPLPSGTILTLIQYKAQVDARGNLLKDANGRFLKGDLIAYTVMEKRTGWGTEYPEDLRNGEWEYGVFTADGTLNDKANYKGCFQCHKPHEKQDFVISYPAMAGRTTAAAPARTSGAAMTTAEFAFGPAKLTVPAGAPVTWTNNDLSPHQISVAGQPLKTGLLLKGQSEALMFPEAGIFEYICALHPNMKGAVEVTK